MQIEEKSIIKTNKNIINLIILLTLITSCKYEYNEKFEGERENYKSSLLLCDGIYAEIYLLNKGDFSRESVYGYYLTDSTNFRIYLGYRFENINYRIDCIGDSIYIEIDNRQLLHNPLNVVYFIENLKTNYELKKYIY